MSEKPPIEDCTEDSPYSEVDDFIEGVLMVSQISTIIGPSHIGKTYIAVDMALHVAAGLPWHGLDVRQGGVLYIALEGAPGVRKRLQAWRKYHDYHVRPLPLFIMHGSLDLRGNRLSIPYIVAAAEKMQKKRGFPVSWIVVDTLNHALGGGSESADADMAALFQGAEELRQATGAHVTLVHQTGWKEKDRMRGSSVLFGNIHTELLVKEGKGAVRSLLVTKQKDAEPGASFHFQLTGVTLDTLDRRGKPRKSAVAAPLSQARLDAIEDDDIDRYLEPVLAVVHEGRGGFPLSAGTRGPRERRLLVVLEAELGLSKAVAVKVLEKLEAAGKIKRGEARNANRHKYEAWLAVEPL